MLLLAATLPLLFPPRRSYGTQTPIQILILRPPIIAHACARSEFVYDSEF